MVSSQLVKIIENHFMLGSVRPSACPECCCPSFNRTQISHLFCHLSTGCQCPKELTLKSFHFKCVNGLAPLYLSDLVQPYVSLRALRSADQFLLVVPKTRLSSEETGSFQSWL
ncbi:hypothetical protein XENORESO_006762 [Xenotaenia resolanae]|uniref:Uncharacterized protein n=1 Tax=Xenotaenia resolanae TaxID=208358 RepID=A0ABV0W1F3_9TELE